MIGTGIKGFKGSTVQRFKIQDSMFELGMGSLFVGDVDVLNKRYKVCLAARPALQTL